MRSQALVVLLFVCSFAFAADDKDNPAAPNAGSSTATARVIAPHESKCPVSDRSKTAQSTQPGCTPGACNSARQSAIARLRGEVDGACDNFVRADADCVKTGC